MLMRDGNILRKQTTLVRVRKCGELPRDPTIQYVTQGAIRRMNVVKQADTHIGTSDATYTSSKRVVEPQCA